MGRGVSSIACASGLIGAVWIATGTALADPPDILWSRRTRDLEVRAVAFTPEASLLGVSVFPCPRAYDAQTGADQGYFGEPSEYTHHDIIFTPDGSLAGVTYGERRYEPLLRWFRVTDKQVVGEIDEPGMEDYIAPAGAVSPDGARVALALRSFSYLPNRLAVYTIGTGERVFSIEVGEGTSFRDVAWSSDGLLIASNGAQTTIHHPDGALAATVPVASSSVAWGPHDEWLAWAGDGLGVADPATGAVLRRIADGEWTMVRTSPDGQVLLASPDAYPACRLAFWATSGWKPIGAFDVDSQYGVFDAAFSAGGALYAVGANPGRMLVALTPRLCPADCDRSGAVDAADFVCFQAAWRAREVYADFDASGRWDVNDFIAFYAESLRPCP